MKRLRALITRFRKELRLYRAILADPETPRITKLLLGLAIAYTLSPIDLIPDFIPILGHLDDLLIVPALVFLALKTIPRPLLEKHRRQLNEHPAAQEQPPASM